MSGSIFGRINRAEYRREMARYPISGTRGLLTHRAWALYVIWAPAWYGALIGYLHAEHPGAYDIAVAWSDPWLVNWLRDYIPALNNIAENYARRGYGERIPFAQHVYAAGILFFAFNLALLDAVIHTLPRPVRAKRLITSFHTRPLPGRRGIHAGYQKARASGSVGGIFLWIALAALGFLFGAYLAFAMYDGSWNTGVIDSGSARYDWLIRRLTGLHIYDSGAAIYLLFATFSPMCIVFGLLVFYYKVRLLLINFRQGLKMRWSANRRR